MAGPTGITRVTIENYKSIAACDVLLDRLTFLIGPNASGKSNFLDALHLVSDALRTTLFQAINERGGMDGVLCRAPGVVRARARPSHFSIRLELSLADSSVATYRFLVVSQAPGHIQLEREECEVSPPTPDQLPATFSRVGGKVTSNITLAPPSVAPDRLYLVNASGLSQFRQVYEALSSMLFYNLDLNALRTPQQNGPGEQLAPTGSNLASVLRRFEQINPRLNERVQAYLANIVPELVNVRVRPITQFLTLQFRMGRADPRYAEDFAASSMSEGTLRALGILVALFQSHAGDVRPSLIAIEGPETALHPAATGVLLDALRDAGEDVQVIVTTHSPDLLDSKEIESTAILVALAQDGVTSIGPLDTADRSLLRDQIYTAGEIMRQGILRPENANGTAKSSAYVTNAG